MTRVRPKPGTGRLDQGRGGEGGPPGGNGGGGVGDMKAGLD